MEQNEHWDREKDYKQLFNPEDITIWQNHTPEEFIALIVLQLRQEREVIEAYTQLLIKDAQIREIILSKINQQLSADFCLETILKATRIQKAILDTAAAYREYQVSLSQNE